MSGLTVEKVEQAVRDRIVFARLVEGELVAVDPVDGQWFCEFEIQGFGELAWVRDGSLVEYVGCGRVCAEDAEYDRHPDGDVLVLQS